MPAHLSRPAGGDGGAGGRPAAPVTAPPHPRPPACSRRPLPDR
jgi:hypothetical protein